MTYLSIFAILILLAITFDSSTIGKEFEWKSIVYRFLMRSELEPNPDIAIILFDEASREQFGEAPYPRHLFATIIDGLKKLNAGVIAIDFRFEDARNEEDDSVFVQAMRNSENVVIGCYFRNVYENYADIETAGIRNTFYESEEMAPVWQPLIRVGARVGHINVFVNQYNGQISSMPCFISVMDSLIPCFPLEITKAFFNIDANSVSLEDRSVRLATAPYRSLKIPTTATGDILINYPGSEDVFVNCYSFGEIHAYCKKILSDTTDQKLTSAFKDKVVLIGSLIDQDIFVTPFSSEFPGVLIHATVIDNILSQRFLRVAPYSLFISLIVLSVLLYFVFLQRNFIRKIVCSLVILLLFIGISFVLFNYQGVIIRTSTPILFIFLASVSLGIFDYIYAMQRNVALNEQVQQMDRLIKSLGANGDLTSGQESFFRLIILYIEERDRCIFPNWLELKEQQQKQVVPFQARLSAKNPVHINLNSIRKLEHDLEFVWQSYYEYVNIGHVSGTSPLTLLQEIGAKIRNQLGLKQTYDTLFRLENQSAPLNLVLGSVNVPWQFAYDPASDQFLCEKYSIGISFVSEKEIKTRSNHRGENQEIKSALLFYGDWQGHPGKELRNAAEAITHLKKMLVKSACDTEIVHENVDQFLNVLAAESDKKSNIRIIHYLGHAEEDYLDIGENDFLQPGVIIETLGVSFSSRPLVFLNACSSGKLPSEWKINDHLCTEFLAAGAGACIVTNFDVYDKTAAAFQKYFYNLYVEQGFTAGEALKQTILAMGDKKYQQNYKPDFDISRYAYSLFGDPALKF